jgi:hypothetical protein
LRCVVRYCLLLSLQLLLSLLWASPVLVRQWHEQTSSPAIVCPCLPQARFSYLVCGGQTFCSGDRGPFVFVVSWFDPFPFLFPRVGACSAQGECCPCHVVPFAFLRHLPILHSSSPSMHPYWPCALLALPRSGCCLVCVASQTTWPAILLLRWLLLFLGREALPL